MEALEALILDFTREEFKQRIRGYLEALDDVPAFLLPTILGIYDDRPELRLWNSRVGEEARLVSRSRP